MKHWPAQRQPYGYGQPNVNGTALSNLLIPFPPPADQHRIVERIEELMSLVDELEVKQSTKRALRISAGKAALRDLTEADDPNAFQHAWERLEGNFEALFSRDLKNIKALRQTVLSLAVRGKLAPQNPDDEPASELLKKIAAEKERMVKEGIIKKPKPLPPIDPDEVPYELPVGWEWCRFGTCTFNRDGERIPLSREERATRQGVYDYYGASGVIDHIDDYLFDKPLLLIGEDGANLINRSTPIAFMARGNYWVNNHAHVIDGISEDFLIYISLYINAIDLKPYVTGTAQPKMNQVKMNSIIVALPPLAEQQSIVNQADFLMGTIAQLAQGVGLSSEIADHYAKTVVGSI